MNQCRALGVRAWSFSVSASMVTGSVLRFNVVGVKLGGRGDGSRGRVRTE